MADERIVERSGYGASFNEIVIKGAVLEKRPYTPHGRIKLGKERKAYEVFSTEAPSFPMAEVLGSTSETLSLRYYKECVPLWSVYKEMTHEQRTGILSSVFFCLDILHTTQTVSLSKEMYVQLFRSEVIEKVQTRYREIEDVLVKYPFSHVNGVQCLTFEEALQKVEERFELYLSTKKSYELSYIHGDPQFSNILYDGAAKKLVFIDPRGYFGDRDLLGPQEYDTAKVLFALSGYDIFDSMSFPEITLEKGTIVLPDFVMDTRYKTLYPELLFLLVSIWLANCHTFKETPNKAVISHAYARYLATSLL